ncbi:MAG: hypothetical protein ACOY33_06555 [Pseudomonadota bacterium]
MSDVAVLGLTHMQWLLLGLAAAVGTLAGWSAVMLLLHPVRPAGIPGLVPIQGYVSAHGNGMATFAIEQLLADFPSPRRFFEQLGPDRFRREFSRALKERLDEHVEDVMTRRNGRSWEALSSYARDRIYAHVHRRLPYVIDDFVDHVQRDLDDIVHPAVLVRRHFTLHPERVAQAFMDSFGADLRAALPVGMLAALAAALPVVLLFDGPWAWAITGGLSAVTASLVVLYLLSRPVERGGIWPLQMQGILHRHRQRFVQQLVVQVVNDALGWRSVVGEFLRGAHAGRVRHMMRREVASILDVPVFRTSMQLLLGPEGFAEVKSSAVEKAVEMLASAPVSVSLREHYRVELTRTLGHAAARVPATAYEALWEPVLERAWRYVPLLTGVGGLLLGAAFGRLLF